MISSVSKTSMYLPTSARVSSTLAAAVHALMTSKKISSAFSTVYDSSPSILAYSSSTSSVSAWPASAPM